MRFFLLLCIMVACVPRLTTSHGAIRSPGTQEQEDLEFRSEAAGFAIRKPGGDWSRSTQPGTHGISELKMSPGGGGAAVQFSIQISVAQNADPKWATEQRDALLEQVQDLATIHREGPTKVEVADRVVPGLQLEQEAGGVTYRVRQAYLVAQGLLYKFQYHAPKSDFDDYAKAFETALGSFTLIGLDESGQRRLRLTELAARCGSEVSQLDD